jgi:hypothetical protein
MAEVVVKVMLELVRDRGRREHVASREGGGGSGGGCSGRGEEEWVRVEGVGHGGRVAELVRQLLLGGHVPN